MRFPYFLSFGGTSMTTHRFIYLLIFIIDSPLNYLSSNVCFYCITMCIDHIIIIQHKLNSHASMLMQFKQKKVEKYFGLNTIQYSISLQSKRISENYDPKKHKEQRTKKMRLYLVVLYPQTTHINTHHEFQRGRRRRRLKKQVKNQKLENKTESETQTISRIYFD